MRLDRDRLLGFYIGFISRQAHRFFEQEFKPYQLGRGSLFILKKLYEKDGVHQSVLQSSIHVDKANITRAVAKLAELGYIRKESDSVDNRANLIYLTDKAYDFKPKFEAIIRKWNDILTAELSKEEKAKLKDMLIRMCEKTLDYFSEQGN